MKRLLLTSVMGLALMAGGASAAEIYVRFGPPPPPREVIVMRPGPRHVWVPGYYRWTGNHYHWVKGCWRKPPRGRMVWVPGHWVPRRGGYVWIAGYWR